MLGGQMSNQDEDEVEDELEALEREVAGPVKLPDVPVAPLPGATKEEKERQAKERAKARAKARTSAAAAPLTA
jgi:charged multivesicular body protein 6